MPENQFDSLVDQLVAAMARTHGVPQSEFLSRLAASRVETQQGALSDELASWSSLVAMWADFGHLAPALALPEPAELRDLDEWLESDLIDDPNELLKRSSQSPAEYDFRSIAKFIDGTAVVVTPTSPGETPRVLDIGEFQAGMWLPAIDAPGSRQALRHEDLPTFEDWLRSLVGAHESGKFIADHQPRMRGLAVAGQTDSAGPPGVWHYYPLDE